MRIGEVARKSRIPASTLRYYERVGLIQPPQRIGRQREYDDSILEVLQIIQFAKRVNFSLDDIRIILCQHHKEKSTGEVWRDLASQKLGEVKKLIIQYQTIEQTLQQGIDCTCQALKDCEQIA